MSVVIIVGGDGKKAVQKLVDVYPHMTPYQKAAALELQRKFIEDVNTLCSGVSVP